MSVSKTIKELIHQRGYQIQKDESAAIIAIHKKTAKKMGVFMFPNTKFRVSHFYEYTSLMKEYEIKHAIIVFKQTITPAAKKLVLSNIEEYRIEFLKEESLSYNITKHVLVPKHIKVSKKEGSEIKKMLSPSNMSKMLVTDAVSMFYGYRPGDVIRIIRKVDGLDYIHYRIVVR